MSIQPRLYILNDDWAGLKQMLVEEEGGGGGGAVIFHGMSIFQGADLANMNALSLMYLSTKIFLLIPTL